jgi:hypothetical protein
VGLGAAAGLYLGVAYSRVLALGLLSAFVGVSVLAMCKRVRVPCNCFGTSVGRFLSWETVVFNVVVMAVAMTSKPGGSANSVVCVLCALAIVFVSLSVRGALANESSLGFDWSGGLIGKERT